MIHRRIAEQMHSDITTDLKSRIAEGIRDTGREDLALTVMLLNHLSGRDKWLARFEPPATSSSPACS
jgi:hypothetical protein